MTEKYLSVTGECVTEKVIEKSRFITTSRHVESEEEARAFISEINARFSDATHNCYAYIPDLTGNSPRFSDDGEPQGTAGIPMLEVIKNKKLVQTAVVVTRYFGGIKLGAGGLVRAYAGCVAENLEAAPKASYETCVQLKISVGYSYADGVTRYAQERGANIISTDYSDGVDFAVAVRKSEEGEFVAGLVNRLNGKVKAERLREYFFPFKI